MTVANQRNKNIVLLRKEMKKEIKKVPLHEWHKENADMIEFEGFCMPISYKRHEKGISEEHVKTRNSATICDVSHMGKFLVCGEGSTELLDFAGTRAIKDMEYNKIRYSLLLKKNAAILDDVLIYKLGKETGKKIFAGKEQDGEAYLVVGNAGNIENDQRHFLKIMEQKNLQDKVYFKNISSDVCEFAIQGPKSVEVIKKSIKSVAPEKMNIFDMQVIKFMNGALMLTRSGYTGEVRRSNGFEILLFGIEKENPWLVNFWEKLISNGAAPSGLGARDTLRVEAGYVLAGKEIADSHIEEVEKVLITPKEARMMFAVNMEKEKFFGKKALKKHKPGFYRVGFIMQGKGSRLDGELLYHEQKPIGRVTSSYISPIKKVLVGQAYVKIEDIGQEVYAIQRGRIIKGRTLNPNKMLEEVLRD